MSLHRDGAPLPLSGLTRRRLLAAGGTVGAAAVVSGLLRPTRAAAATGTADEFDTLRARAADLLTGGAIDPTDNSYAAALSTLSTQAAQWLQAMDTSATRTTLWADLPITSTDPSNFGNSLGRLQTLATAWATPGTAQYGSAGIATAVVSGLALIQSVAYNANSPKETGNWWYWEIGGARDLMNICVLMYDHIPADQLAAHLATVDRWCPDPDQRIAVPGLAETGANRADKALNVALRGIVGKDAAKLAAARDGLSDAAGNGRDSLFTYVTSGDGFYRDGSFVQHSSMAYTGTYGTVMLSDLATMIALLGGSTWQVTDPNVSVLLDSVDRSFAPLVKDGLMMDTVRGRAVAREAETDLTDGATTVTAVLLLAQGAPEPYATHFRELAKGWIERNTYQPYLGAVGVPAISSAKALLADGSIAAAAQTTGSWVFADMDRVVHRRPDWSYTISMSSHRIADVEWGNGENMHGWYTGDGMTYLYTGDLGQFNDSFWPTVNPYRLPGTTVDTRPRADLTSGGFTYYLSPETWVGGAVLDGRWTSAGMSIAPRDVTLRGKKSWFLLDDAVVALGAGITSTDGRTIETVVDNRNLHAGGTRFTVDGRTQPVTDGWTAGPRTPAWAHLDGVAGYVFPRGGDGTSLHALRELRTGAWDQIDNGPGTGGDDVQHTREYLTLWYDHGVSPTDAGYAHVVLPGASASQTAVWAAARPVRILANGAAVQAVEAPQSGLTAANFWQPGEVAGVLVDGPAAVVLRAARGQIRVAVSDPSRTATTLRLELPYPARRVVSADSTVSVSCGPRPVLTVNVDGSHGHTHSAVLSTGS